MQQLAGAPSMQGIEQRSVYSASGKACSECDAHRISPARIALERRISNFSILRRASSIHVWLERLIRYT
jgi:hypothetical protein